MLFWIQKYLLVLIEERKVYFYKPVQNENPVWLIPDLFKSKFYLKGLLVQREDLQNFPFFTAREAALLGSETNLSLHTDSNHLKPSRLSWGGTQRPQKPGHPDPPARRGHLHSRQGPTQRSARFLQPSSERGQPSPRDGDKAEGISEQKSYTDNTSGFKTLTTPSGGLFLGASFTYYFSQTCWKNATLNAI